MSDLWLTFQDETGTETRVKADRDQYTIGRHSANDLTITDSRLSREHARIERTANGFVIYDLGSSNGTFLNGTTVTGSPIRLATGDEIDLGGGVRLAVEIEAAEPASLAAQELPAPEAGFAQDAGLAPAPPATVIPAAPAETSGGLPLSVFLIAPIAALLMLAIVGGVLWMFVPRDTRATVRKDAYDTENGENDLKEPTPTPVSSRRSATPEKTLSTGNNTQANDTKDLPGPTPAGSGIESAIEKDATAFLHRMSNDPGAFLQGYQAKRVAPKLRQMAASPALAENLNSARKNASAISSLAASKGFKPQFLAIAALTKLGTNRGDVLEAAKSVADVYAKLRSTNPVELSDEALVVVAAYEQGAAGKTNQMRDLIESVARTENVSPRTARSIWFLDQKGKLSAADLDRAITFLAIGTISQNPKEFGVKAEALEL